MVVGDAISRYEVAGMGTMTRTIAVLSTLALGVAFPRAQTVPVKTLDIYVVDVEGGNATLFDLHDPDSQDARARWPFVAMWDNHDEADEHRFPRDHPLRPLAVADVDGRPAAAVNLLLHHGVQSCLEYQRTGDAAAARRASNPDLAPHLAFLDRGGHGDAVVRIGSDAMECEFVCIPRPLERSPAPDGGPIRYRVVHRAPLWRGGARPQLEQRVIEGDPELAL